MKLLSMDYGRRRIGLAITDETGTLIRGLTTIDRKFSADPLVEILEIISIEKPSSLIVGLPLDENNDETAMTQEIRLFVDTLKEKIDLPVHFVDESYSSIKASQLLLNRKKKVRRDKTTVDRIAACLILETYMRDQSSEIH